ncbi:hypothetical protein [Campylobacter devanensis]|uniref:hypothetical protein n=1 Tax=Campylobacter devanensis TaxID=3161138 RepID=UPI000A342AFC|nr:hypothetical protein [Campylobacter sp. P0088]
MKLLLNLVFYELGFTQSHFDVRKNNLKVVTFHKKFGAIITSKDDENYYFNFALEYYVKTRKNMLNF